MSSIFIIRICNLIKIYLFEYLFKVGKGVLIETCKIVMFGYFDLQTFISFTRAHTVKFAE